MAAFVEDGKLEVSVGNLSGELQDVLERFDRLLRTKDHSVGLPDEMQNIRPLAAESAEAVEKLFGACNFETRPEGPAGIDERDEILRIFCDRFVEGAQRFVETVELPQGARFAQ